jgi:hypothetical protein
VENPQGSVLIFFFAALRVIQVQPRVSCENGHLLNGDLVQAFKTLVLREFFRNEQ